jgi:Fe-S cluster assembly protein SufD
MSIQVSSEPVTVDSPATQRETLLRQLLGLRLDLPQTNLRDEVRIWLQSLRQEAIAQVQSQTLPSRKDEEWRFTDLSPLLAMDIQTAEAGSATITKADIQDWEISESAGSQLVFVDGCYAADLSATDTLPAGVVVGSLLEADVQTRHASLNRYLAQQSTHDDVFAALNTAGLADAAIVWLPRNCRVEHPIHLLFLTSGQATSFNQPRCLVVAETNSSLTLVEEYASLSDQAVFTNGVTEIWVEANARIEHIRVQHEGDRSIHIGKTAIHQGRDSYYCGHSITTGAQLSRHNWMVNHAGEQVETILNGLTRVGGEQVADTHSAIAYTHPHCISRQLHKCIVDDCAHAIFNGKVFVPKAAQLTDARQLNQNLLLSPKARVDTKPQLEIVADNVKCAHGATVSQLDADEVFYLQSRGIGADQSQKLLIYAFAFELLDQIPVPSMRDRLIRTVANHASP